MPENPYEPPTSRMQLYRISLASLLLFAVALPLWAFLILVVGSSPGFGPRGFLVAPVALVAATAAVFRLVRDRKNGLAIAALLASVVLTGAITIVAAISRTWN